MKYLFVFAHPDDETVACAGTIRQLVAAGHGVQLVHTTDGGAGEVTTPTARKTLRKLGSVKALRQQEMHAVCQHLGLSDYQVLDFPDGTIANAQVWGLLKESIIEIFEAQKPDVVITFDHTGWYYHLDHIGTSIATTLAYQQAAHQPSALLFSLFRPTGSSRKWNYVYSEKLPVSHRVQVADRMHKLQTMALHVSQDLRTPRAYVQEQTEHFELYQLAFANSVGQKLLQQHPIFEAV